MRKTPMWIACAALMSCSAPAPTPAPAPSAPPPAPAAESVRPPPKTDGKTVVDVAAASPDHTTLVTAVKATDLVYTLGSPGGVYTVFAPTNAAFDKLPPGTVEALLKPEKKAELKSVLQHHATVPVLGLKSLHDGQVLGMADGTKVTVHVKDGKVMIDNANIVGTVQASNGVVHVIDAVLLPPPPKS